MQRGPPLAGTSVPLPGSSYPYHSPAKDQRQLLFSQVLFSALTLPEETPASEDPPAVWVQMGLVTFSPSAPRKAVKATLVLLPLLGITYMLFFVNPGEDELSQIVFIYFNSFLQSFQVGRMVGWGRSEPP